MSADASRTPAAAHGARRTATVATNGPEFVLARRTERGPSIEVHAMPCSGILALNLAAALLDPVAEPGMPAEPRPAQSIGRAVAQRKDDRGVPATVVTRRYRRDR